MNSTIQFSNRAKQKTILRTHSPFTSLILLAPFFSQFFLGLENPYMDAH